MVPFPDYEGRWGVWDCRWRGNVEPETVADGVGGCFGCEDEMVAWGKGFYAVELGGRGEGEEVDAAEN